MADGGAIHHLLSAGLGIGLYMSFVACATEQISKTSPMRGSFYKSRAGTALYFERDGEHGWCVFCLHGFGASREAWDEIRPLLTCGAQHYFVDLKKFGSSDSPSDERDVPQAQAALIKDRF